MAVVWKEIAYKDDLNSHASQHGVSGSDSVFPADPDADKYLMWDNDPGELVWGAGGSGGNCNIKTGTYTGDGSTGQAITGVGFRPKWLAVMRHPDTGGAFGFLFYKMDQSWGAWSINQHAQDSDWVYTDNRLISLDADGFTVGDVNTDVDPNKNGEVYDYIAFG